jgi:hypothetical protein
MTDKICSKCKINKSVLEFYKRNDTKCGFRSHCKSCVSTRETEKRDRQRGSKRKNCKYSFNEDRLLQDDLLTWYIAGLLAADGHIHEKKQSVSLTLKMEDIETIKIFKEYFEYDGVVSMYQNKYPYVRINGSKKTVSILNDKFNITPKKSLTLLPPCNIPSSEHALAYIIGYIDGDGCIYTTPKITQLQILGTEDLLNFILGVFSEYCNVSNLRPRKSSSENVLQICFSGNLTNNKCKYYNILKKMKELPVPKMERKWSKLVF